MCVKLITNETKECSYILMSGTSTMKKKFILLPLQWGARRPWPFQLQIKKCMDRTPSLSCLDFKDVSCPASLSFCCAFQHLRLWSLMCIVSWEQDDDNDDGVILFCFWTWVLILFVTICLFIYLAIFILPDPSSRLRTAYIRSKYNVSLQ